MHVGISCPTSVVRFRRISSTPYGSGHTADSSFLHTHRQSMRRRGAACQSMSNNVTRPSFCQLCSSGILLRAQGRLSVCHVRVGRCFCYFRGAVMTSTSGERTDVRACILHQILGVFV
ncbi:hypothetical protein LZ30DRAFT_702503 [Colletotrichum cereale]|nr:hypothetical protein LZ30DRAFT_702503 [Colletotrichum cereale]